MALEKLHGCLTVALEAVPENLQPAKWSRLGATALASTFEKAMQVKLSSSRSKRGSRNRGRRRKTWPHTPPPHQRSKERPETKTPPPRNNELYDPNNTSESLEYPPIAATVKSTAVVVDSTTCGSTSKASDVGSSVPPATSSRGDSDSSIYFIDDDDSSGSYRTNDDDRGSGDDEDTDDDDDDSSSYRLGGSDSEESDVDGNNENGRAAPSAPNLNNVIDSEIHCPPSLPVPTSNDSRLYEEQLPVDCMPELELEQSFDVSDVDKGSATSPVNDDDELESVSYL